MSYTMRIAYNSATGVDSRSSSAISEVWFTKTFNSGTWAGDNETGCQKICYKIQPTLLGIYPLFPHLMEYNRYGPEDIKYYEEVEIDGVHSYVDPDGDSYGSGSSFTPKYYIGESLTLSELGISKFIFPQKLINAGYRYATIFYNPTSDPDWYEDQRNIEQDKRDEFATKFYREWKYRVFLEGTSEGEAVADPLNNLDSVIQFSTVATNEAETMALNLLTAVHESNYSNPHASQISTLATTNAGGNLISEDNFNTLLTTPNAFIIGNQMYHEDFSMRYLGDYLYLVDLVSIIWKPGDGMLPYTDDQVLKTNYYQVTLGSSGEMDAIAVPANSRIQNAAFKIYCTDGSTNGDPEHGIPATDYIWDNYPDAYDNETDWRNNDGDQWALIQSPIDSHCILYAPKEGHDRAPKRVKITIEGSENICFYAESSELGAINITLDQNTSNSVIYNV